MPLENYVLSQNEKDHILSLKNAGQYALAYRYISERIDTAVQNETMSAATQKWFDWAAQINGNEPTLINSYARTFTRMGAAKDGITITDAEFQEASDTLAASLLDGFLVSGYIPMTPESIVLNDIQNAVSMLGIDNEDFAGTLIGSFLFDTPTLEVLILNDPTNAGIWNQMSAFSEQVVKHGLIMGAIGTGLVTDAIADVYALFATAIERFSPLALDLDNDGIELTAYDSDAAVYFDRNGDGFSESGGWVGSDDGILVVDLNEDGIINDASELFGNQTGPANGFLALAQYDTNDDDQVTAEDFGFRDLLVWRDLNVDGYSQEGELFSLPELSITAISTAWADVTDVVNGNDIFQRGTFLINGQTQDIVDAYFATDSFNTVYNEEFVFDEAVMLMATVRGYGLLPSLHIAMSLDNDGGDPDSLISLVTEFSGLAAEDIFSGSALDAVKDILFRWAGVDAVSPTARGANVDGRELAFLEKMTGQEFRQWGWNPDPYPDAGRDLTRAFQMALNHVYGVLASQTEAGAELFGAGAFYNIAADALDGFTALDAGALDALETAAAGLANNAAREEFWTGVVRVVEYALGVSGISGGDEAALDAAIYDSGLTLEDTDSLLALATGNTNAPVFAPTYGTSGADTLTGGAGDDYVAGRVGADLLYGEAGNDTRNGRNSNDIFFYTSGHGVFSEQGTNGTDTLEMAAGYIVAGMKARVYSRLLGAMVFVFLLLLAASSASAEEAKTKKEFVSGDAECPVSRAVYKPHPSLRAGDYSYEMVIEHETDNQKIWAGINLYFVVSVREAASKKEIASLRLPYGCYSTGLTSCQIQLNNIEVVSLKKDLSRKPVPLNKKGTAPDAIFFPNIASKLKYAKRSEKEKWLTSSVSLAPIETSLMGNWILSSCLKK